MSSLATERDWILADLAARTGLTPIHTLAAAVADLPGDGSRTLADLLESSGVLGPGERGLLEGMVEASLRAHGGDAGSVLTGLETGSVRNGSEAVEVTLTHVPSDASTAAPITAGGSSTVSDRAEVTASWDSGRFRHLRFHARGGLGEVFVAHDAELDREVALKRIQGRHADHPGHRARFVVEAEVTGGLEHPGIVPVYSLGADADGRPFYAMRFIRGESLDKAVADFHQPGPKPGSDPAERTLAFRRLLGRLVDACEAMAYAHSRGVIHRDLKPGNIMLGKFGETLVVDWGLARPQGRSDVAHGSGEDLLVPASGSGVAPTELGSVLGTPAFMSPEQARGEIDQLGPASDVYSLGATLYAVLTGSSPYRGGPPIEILDRVRRGDAPPPRALRPEVPAALEAICRKAMAPRPESRYASALDLADDLEHWLADEPVGAYREPWAVRLARWRRRHSTLVTAAAAVLVAALAALAMGTLAVNAERAVAVRERDRARGEHARAEAEFRRARRAVDDSFTRVSQDVLLNVPGLQPLRRDLLAAARAYYEEFVRDRGDDPALRAELAQTRTRLGDVSEAMGEDAEALRSYEAAARLREEIAADEPGDAENRLALAQDLDRLGSYLMHRSGGLPRARRLIERAIALAEPLADRGDGEADGPNFLAGAYANLGAVSQLEGRSGAALPLYRRGATIREGLVRSRPESPGLRLSLARLLVDLARICQQAGPASETSRSIERAVALLDKLHRERPDAALYTFELGLALADLGRLSFYGDDLAAARRHLGRAEDLLGTLARENPRATEYRVNLAALGNVLANLDRREGRPDLAARHVGIARDLFEGLARDHPEVPDYREALSQSWNVSGRLAAVAGRRPEALAAFDRAAALVGDLPDQIPTHRYNFACNTSLGLPLVAADPARLTASERAEVGARAARAVDALRQAAAKGLTNIDFYLHDEDLDPLRGRDDFRAFLDTLRDRGFPADPFAR